MRFIRTKKQLKVLLLKICEPSSEYNVYKCLEENNNEVIDSTNQSQQDNFIDLNVEANLAILQNRLLASASSKYGINIVRERNVPSKAPKKKIFIIYLYRTQLANIPYEIRHFTLSNVKQSVRSTPCTTPIDFDVNSGYKLTLIGGGYQHKKERKRKKN
ncbi:CLUMA_CG021430, isoform A [Clunio marinus]|uniref:CLUMA_CG021430, isoform A n=1 Tax=Clunio marinus TaxID=568069 RepID=A0A1J1J7N9_9DIPT|nr:CLUMA_CG021430, isoform A [Clunio marinus]